MHIILNITLDIEKSFVYIVNFYQMIGIIKKNENKCSIKDIELPKIRLISEFLVSHSHTSCS